MSQAKVEQYKKNKANRKKILAKEKLEQRLWKVCGCVVLLAIVCGFAYSGYSYYESNQPTKTIYTDTSAITDYVSELDTETE